MVDHHWWCIFSYKWAWWEEAWHPWQPPPECTGRGKSTRMDSLMLLEQNLYLFLLIYGCWQCARGPVYPAVNLPSPTSSIQSWLTQVSAPPGLDKIKTFRDHSINLSKLSVKVHKLRQQNLRQKVRNLWNQESEIKLILFLVLKFLSS